MNDIIQRDMKPPIMAAMERFRRQLKKKITLTAAAALSDLDSSSEETT
ncbi:MAG: hypothetical protein V3S51_04205 [Dehalococcoidia bacterium]